MKLAHIVPTKSIKKFGSQGDITLALAHLLDNQPNDYEKAIIDAKLPILLDNGLFENLKPEGIDSLITKARRIGAYGFFAPDHLYNAKKTLRALETTIDVAKQLNWRFEKTGIAVVIQADNEKDYLELYDRVQSIPEVILIGLSILSIPKCFQKPTDQSTITDSRIRLLKKLLERGNNNKQCHLLGLGDSYQDVLFAKQNCPFVVSNDTSCCFQSGLFGKRLIDSIDNLEVPGGKVKPKVDFELTKISRRQSADIQFNIDQVKKHVSNQS